MPATNLPLCPKMPKKNKKKHVWYEPFLVRRNVASSYKNDSSWTRDGNAQEKGGGG